MKGCRFGLRDGVWAAIVIVVLFLWLGRQDGKQSPPSFFGPNPGPVSYAKAYYVGDLGTPIAEKVDQAYLDRLTAEMAATVTPNEWQRGASISAFETNQSIVVSHTQAGHVRVAKFLRKSDGRPGRRQLARTPRDSLTII